MPLLALLKAKWTFMGLEAPCFIWLAALSLVLGTCLQILRLWKAVARERRIQQQILVQLERLGAEHGGGGRTGLSVPAYEAVERIFAEQRTLWPVWNRFADQVLVRYDMAGQPRMWSSDSAAATLNMATMIEPRINQYFFAAVPGILTSAGLLCTFVAILVSLLDVRLVNGQFHGLDNLLSGLSGKFLSSIMALGAATVFLIVERCLLYRLTAGTHALSTQLDGLLPRLPMTVILSDLQCDLRDHLGSTQACVERLVQVTERQGQEPLGQTLAAFLQRFEHAITGALERFDEKVSEGMAGTGPQEMARVGVALETMSRLLEGVRSESRLTRTALGEVATLTNSAALEHIAASQAQTADVTTTLQGFLGHMHEATGLSMQQMAATLTTVVHDLSSQVQALGERLTQTVLESAGQAAGAASAVIARADGWSDRSAAQLTQLLEQHQGQLDSRHAMQTTFETALQQFKEALGQYTTVTVYVRQVASAAADITRAIKETGSTVERTASMAALQAERFAEIVRRQEDVQQHIAQSLRQYQQVFSQAMQATQAWLAQMEQHAQHYQHLGAVHGNSRG